MMARKKPTPADYPPPEGLSERAQALWRGVVPSRAVSAGRLALIEEALRSLDRADQCRAIVGREGPTFTTTTTGAVHQRPEIRLERESRALFAKLWTGMYLQWSNEEDGRVYHRPASGRHSPWAPRLPSCAAPQLTARRIPPAAAAIRSGGAAAAGRLQAAQVLSLRRSLWRTAAPAASVQPGFVRALSYPDLCRPA
jgi:hypothetical protein